MSDTVQQDMHEQHLQWDRDAQTWRADIEQWKRELQDAVRDLNTIRAAMDDSLSALDNHGEAVREHLQRLKAHDGVIRDARQQGVESTDEAGNAAHEAEAARHGRLNDAHERIKHHQHGMVAEVKHLLECMMEAI